MPSACAIYQENLDAVSRALWAGDIDEILRWVALPKRMVTTEGEFVIDNRQDAEILIRDYRALLKKKGATDYRRMCRHAEFVTDAEDAIYGMHQSFIRKDGAWQLHGANTRMLLVRTQVGYKVAQIETAPEHQSGTFITREGIEHLLDKPLRTN